MSQKISPSMQSISPFPSSSSPLQKHPHEVVSTNVQHANVTEQVGSTALQSPSLQGEIRDVFVRQGEVATPSPLGGQEAGPSSLVRNSIQSIASKFSRYEHDGDLVAPVYWNTNSIDRESRIGRDVSVTHERWGGQRATSFESTTHRGTASDTQTHRVGPEAGPEDTRGTWTQPFALTLGSWWKGRSDGTGVKASRSGQVEGKLGTASAQATVYSEVRTDVGFGGRISGTGVDGSAAASVSATAIGAQVTGEIRSPSTKIAGQDVDVHAGVHVQPYIGAEAGVYAAVDVNARRPAASIAVGGSAFAGARVRSHVEFGLGSLLTIRPTAEGWAGAGAEASASVGYDKGKFSLGASAGVGLGLGGKLGLEVEVDVAAAAKMAHHAADRDGDGKLSLHDAAVGIQQAGDALASGADAVRQRTLQLARGTMRAGMAMIESAKEAGGSLVSQFSSVADAAASSATQQADSATQQAKGAISRLSKFFGFSS